MDRHRSSAAPLALAWAAVIVYASLFPFDGWRWPPGVPAWQLLRLPWPRYFIPFDITSNLLGYAPLGFLLALARLRQGAALLPAWAGAVLVGLLLSYAMELTQHLLPQRVPSALDWLLNAGGTALGAVLAAAFRALGLLARWQALRGRWLARGNGGALALLLLWPLALLFPTPVPLGVGQIGPELREALEALLSGVPWADGAAQWLAADAKPPAPSPLADGLAVALGLLAPCLVAFAASHRGLRRLWLVAGAAGLGVGATMLSAALSFGPDHALAWTTPVHLAALLLGAVAALPLLWLGPRVAGGLALVALTGLVVLVHQAPTDPYYAQSLQDWEQGRFIRFHGLAQWLGWLWPFGAIGWVLARLGEPRRPGGED
jgi:VanZ family protein